MIKKLTFVAFTLKFNHLKINTVMHVYFRKEKIKGVQINTISSGIFIWFQDFPTIYFGNLFYSEVW